MAQPPPGPVGPLDIVPTFGAALIGCFGMMGLYGVTCVQTYFYFSFYPDDSKVFKGFVWLIWLLDSLHICLVCHAMFHYLVLNFSQPAVLTHGIWSLWTSVLLNCVIACVVQGFFAGRLYLLVSRSTKTWLMPIVILLILCHLVFGVETSIFGLVTDTFEEFQAKAQLVGALPFALFAVLSDFCIAICLCVKLQRTKVYLMTANSVFNQLIIFSVNRCLLTAGVAVLEIVLFALFPDNLWYLALDFAIGKLYANSLLATLNTRYSIRARSQQHYQTGKSINTVDGEVPSFQVHPTERGNHRLSTVVQMTVMSGDGSDHVQSMDSLGDDQSPKPESSTMKNPTFDENWHAEV